MIQTSEEYLLWKKRKGSAFQIKNGDYDFKFIFSIYTGSRNRIELLIEKPSGNGFVIFSIYVDKEISLFERSKEWKDLYRYYYFSDSSGSEKLDLTAVIIYKKLVEIKKELESVKILLE